MQFQLLQEHTSLIAENVNKIANNYPSVVTLPALSWVGRDQVHQTVWVTVPMMAALAAASAELPVVIDMMGLKINVCMINT